MSAIRELAREWINVLEPPESPKELQRFREAIDVARNSSSLTPKEKEEIVTFVDELTRIWAFTFLSDRIGYPLQSAFRHVETSMSFLEEGAYKDVGGHPSPSAQTNRVGRLAVGRS